MLALAALALAAGRAAAEAHCVPDLSQAGPHGELCSGRMGGPPSTGAQAASLTPSAASQLTGAVGGMVGNLMGNAIVAPLANQYQGHVPVKSVVSGGDDLKPDPSVGAADDIIGNYQANDDSYGAKLAHFRQLHDAEMQQRRDALELIRGTSAEKWCAAHINILFPSPPVSDILNRYANTVRGYDREKQNWDKRCGGPSAMPGYQSFTDELAALKPDSGPGAGSPAAAQQAQAVKATAPTYSAPDAPAKPSSADEDEAPPTPAQTKAQDGAAGAPAPSAPSADGSTPAAPDASAAQAPPPDAAPSPGATADSSKNTNQSTNFFGIPNAKITAADLQDQRAPDLTSPKLGSAPSTPSSGGAAAASSAKASNAGGESPIGSTPRMLSAHGAPDVHMEPDIRWHPQSGEVDSNGSTCQVSCADALDNQSAALDRFHAKSVQFSKAIIMAPLQHGLDLAHAAFDQNIEDMKAGKYGIQDDPASLPDMMDIEDCATVPCQGLTAKAAAAGTPSIGHDKNGNDQLNGFSTTVANWLQLDAGSTKPRQPPIFWMKAHLATFDDIAGAHTAEALNYAAGKYDAVRTSLFENPYFKQMRDEYKAKYNGAKAAYGAVRDYIHGTNECLGQPEENYDECMKAQDKAIGAGMDALKTTPLAAAATRVDEARKAFEPYVGDVLHTSEDLMMQAIHCLGGCP